MTGSAAMQALREKYRHDLEARKVKEEALAQRQLRRAERNSKSQLGNERFKKARWEMRAYLASKPVHEFQASVRKMKVRRATAVQNAIKRRKQNVSCPVNWENALVLVPFL